MTLKRSAISGSSGSSKYEGGSTANRPANPSVGQLYFDTDLGGLLIYNGASWSTFIAPPTVVTVTNRQAIDNGLNREYVSGSNGSITVNFSRSELGGYPTSYTITASPGGASQTVTSPTATFTGLTAGQTYTFSIVANSAYSSSSAGTTSATATTKPQAPTISSVSGASTADLGRLRVNFTPGANGGLPVTHSAVINGVGTITGSSSPLEFTGLTAGQTYTATLSSTNSNGTSTSVSSSGIASRYICPSGGTLSGTTCSVATQYNASASTQYQDCAITYGSGRYTCSYSSASCCRTVINRTLGKAFESEVGPRSSTTVYSCPSGGTLSGTVCYTTTTYSASIG